MSTESEKATKLINKFLRIEQKIFITVVGWYDKDNNPINNHFNDLIEAIILLDTFAILSRENIAFIKNILAAGNLKVVRTKNLIYSYINDSREFLYQLKALLKYNQNKNEITNIIKQFDGLCMEILANSNE